MIGQDGGRRSSRCLKDRRFAAGRRGPRGALQVALFTQGDVPKCGGDACEVHEIDGAYRRQGIDSIEQPRPVGGLDAAGHLVAQVQVGGRPRITPCKRAEQEKSNSAGRRFGSQSTETFKHG